MIGQPPPYRETPAQQKARALQKARDTRMARAAYKRWIRELDTDKGQAEACALILEPPIMLGGMRVVELLKTIHGFGEFKVKTVLMRCQVAWSKTLDGLTFRQRIELAGALGHPRAQELADGRALVARKDGATIRLERDDF